MLDVVVPFSAPTKQVFDPEVLSTNSAPLKELVLVDEHVIAPVISAAPSTSRLSHCSSPVMSTPSDLVSIFLELS